MSKKKNKKQNKQVVENNDVVKDQNQGVDLLNQNQDKSDNIKKDEEVKRPLRPHEYNAMIKLKLKNKEK